MAVKASKKNNWGREKRNKFLLDNYKEKSSVEPYPN